MPLTFQELKERLKSLDPMDIVEILKIDSEELVARFEDLVEENISSVEEELLNWFDDHNNDNYDEDY